MLQQGVKVVERQQEPQNTAERLKKAPAIEQQSPNQISKEKQRATAALEVSSLSQVHSGGHLALLQHHPLLPRHGVRRGSTQECQPGPGELRASAFLQTGSQSSGHHWVFGLSLCPSAFRTPSAAFPRNTKRLISDVPAAALSLQP